MRDECLQRQVALVSYGNKYLRDELTLDAFFRHGIFFGQRLQFRALDGNGLMADDFTLWLAILRGMGARRLSLHRAAEFNGGAELVLAVHFADHVQLWDCGQEPAAWWSHPRLPEGGYQYASDCPPAAAYGGAIDSYWCARRIEGQLAVPDTDWKALAAAIRADLQMTLATSTSKPFCANRHDVPDWANFPLIPYNSAMPLPHQLLAMLSAGQAQFANDANCKNENSYFYHLGEQAQEEQLAWGRRLDTWLVDVLLHCANEFRLKDARAQPIAPAAQAAPLSPKAQARRAAKAAKAADKAANAAPQPASEPDGKWFKAAVFATLLGLMSLLLLAVCSLVASHAWLAPLLGLPFALYVYRQGK
jgi:hypothetical protein